MIYRVTAIYRAVIYRFDCNSMCTVNSIFDKKTTSYSGSVTEILNERTEFQTLLGAEKKTHEVWTAKTGSRIALA